MTRFFRRLWRSVKTAFSGRELEDVLLGHWVPPYNTSQSFEAGWGRCYHCHTHESDPDFDLPCPRKRPSTVELA